MTNDESDDRTMHAKRRTVLQGLVGTLLAPVMGSHPAHAKSMAKDADEIKCEPCAKIREWNQRFRRNDVIATDSFVSDLHTELEVLADPEGHTFGDGCGGSLPEDISKQDVLDWDYEISVAGRRDITATVNVERPPQPIKRANVDLTVSTEDNSDE